jgi:Fic family protein
MHPFIHISRFVSNRHLFISSGHDLSSNLDIQKLVTNGLIPAHQNGRLRQEPVVVYDPVSREIAYLPPDYQDVPRLQNELIHFVQRSREQVDPLIIAAIFHKQFVIIHPFADGNGRSARLVTTALLASLGLNLFPLFSFENYYNQNISRYFQQVGLIGNYYDIVENVDFTPWLEYFTDGIIDELLRVEAAIAQQSKSYQVLKPHEIMIIDYIKVNGFITNQQYSEITTRAKPTRSKDFQELVEKGILERKGKTRGTYYVIK